MKVDETVPVHIAGQVVAHARIAEIGEGKVTLIVPGTMVVMATRTQIDVPRPEDRDTSGTTQIIDGVERTSADARSTAPVDSQGGDTNGNSSQSTTDSSNQGESGTTTEEAGVQGNATEVSSKEPVAQVSSETVQQPEQVTGVSNDGPTTN